MPQINRIRVNNVKYNFGTQFYDDFVMRFSCQNSIYDLANGGGKSVLMLLLLQNLIPNCTLDDKQPIEKLFRSPNASTTIHSLVEWKLDSYDVRDGYRYMTTGFCAKKGKDNGDEAHNDNGAANIEYFNYVIFYKEFGENDIKNLPLQNGNERVTYNGLKAYLRELNHKDLGVEVHVFERKGDYQNFISNYGLYESQWEIIRGINKTEGHVRTFFETNYRTTRKVVEDLLIEEIIEKSYNNKIRKDSDDDIMMAKTLMDIKGKLTELAKRKAEIGSYDLQLELIKNFGVRLSQYEEFYSERDKVCEDLVKCLAICKKELANKLSKRDELAQILSEYDAAYEDEARLSAISEIELEYHELEKLCALIEDSMHERKMLSDNLDTLEEELKEQEVISHYAEYLENKKQYDEVKELIAGAGTDSDDLVRRMSELAAQKKIYFDQNRSRMECQLTEVNAKLSQLSSEIEKSEQSFNESYANYKAAEAVSAELNNKCEVLETEISGLLSEASAVSTDDFNVIAASAQEQLDNITEQIQVCEEQIVAETERKEGLIHDEAAFAMKADALMGDVIRLEKELAMAKEAEERLSKFRSIYSASTNAVLLELTDMLYNNLIKEDMKLAAEIAAGEEYKECLSQKTLPKPDAQYTEVLEYLRQRYKNDIHTGNEILMQMSTAEREAALKSFPQMPYVIYADSEYDTIINDKVIMSLNTGSHIIPILRLGERELGFNNAQLAYRSVAYMWDEVALQAELEKNAEDVQIMSDRRNKLLDKINVIEDDINTIKELTKLNSIAQAMEQQNKAKADLLVANNRKDECHDTIEHVQEKINALRADITGLSASRESLNHNLVIANRAKQFMSELSELNIRKRKYADEQNSSKKLYSVQKEKLSNLENQLQEQNLLRTTLAARFEEYGDEWNTVYAPYYVESMTVTEMLPEEEIDAKTVAYIKLLKENSGNLSDKERLLESYTRNMKKAEQDIRYQGCDLVKAKALYDQKGIISANLESRLAIKQDSENIKAKITQKDSELDSQNAQKNRIEGGIEHAIMRYTEKYGEYTRSEIDNPQAEIVRHRNAMSTIKENILSIQHQIKEAEDTNKDLIYAEKDLTRVVKNAGVNIDERVLLEMDINERPDAELAQKQFDELLQRENRLKKTYSDAKETLIDKLKECKALELAHEFKQSLVIPVDAADAKRLYDGITDTAECIELERNRVEKSITDMELIKDNFENRCIQICSNIKTELDRLTKLSQITLDDEQIPIVSLHIPYIAESLYKDRMGVYINETVSGAETFKDADEKLKYIRNRLSWKKLFSVIVTDMNSIRLNLYKREHIKDQSRFLKYEEAVGSTGQSQGIYIQFLISIINYIANINAMGKDGSVTGKTIFIDNPFGAAKDVYIWEPIFKMLKTNHVQLIVPARGTTPAITSMFDVNYILGQKLVGKLQQTVVVDYRSQIKTEEMDFATLDFEQITFDFK